MAKVNIDVLYKFVKTFAGLSESQLQRMTAKYLISRDITIPSEVESFAFSVYDKYREFRDIFRAIPDDSVEEERFVTALLLVYDSVDTELFERGLPDDTIQYIDLDVLSLLVRELLPLTVQYSVDDTIERMIKIIDSQSDDIKATTDEVMHIKGGETFIRVRLIDAIDDILAIKEESDARLAKLTPYRDELDKTRDGGDVNVRPKDIKA